ncbi:hypothetical protein LF887_09150 [Chryseobacterium sp. MEBOG06]|uniref:hypothetical protein n=1 Tax=Chryseobacterium sp. MEBOG06 TaxID=2879938 RepID=UPI001F474A00|nr:hypothetical protein [Chryseobacterium sp. MEBOG06]UKB85767.1 hypothetical protein LF887_09150 [Chryseobacterium sp. MEBOG06]
MRKTVFITLLFWSVYSAKGQKQQISSDSISIFFDEIKMASKKNTGLWNQDLYGPMILVASKTRTLFADEPDTGAQLKPNGNIYTGILPDNVNIANTAVGWSGKRWAMIMLPLPKNKADRINLLAHESFHRIQPSLGFVLNNVENNHLDLKEGRIYLRLEAEALKKALQSSSEKEMQQHLTHALTFRKYRNILYTNSAETENLLELNEGLAEFTGIIASGRNKAETIVFFRKGIDGFLKNPTFVRSFAYHTTPVYGYLLYQKDRDWNKKVTAKTDLTDLFIKSIIIPADLKSSVNKISGHYNGSAITVEEINREEKSKKLIAEYKSRFIDNPHFEIKFEKMNISFDPGNIVPVEVHTNLCYRF